MGWKIIFSTLTINYSLYIYILEDKPMVLEEPIRIHTTYRCIPGVHDKFNVYTYTTYITNIIRRALLEIKY